MKRACLSPFHSRMWLYSLLLISAFLSVGRSEVSGQACCPTTTLNISTAFNPNTGGLVAPGAWGSVPPPLDPKWTICSISNDMRFDIDNNSGGSISSVPPGGAANVVATFGGWYAASTTANWISCLNANSFTKTISPPAVYDFVACRNFTLCVAATVTVNMNVAADNCITSILVAGTDISFAHPCGPVGPAGNYSVTTTVPPVVMSLPAGTHQIRITVGQDTSGIAAGLLVEGTISASANALASETTACAGFPCTPTISGPTEVCVDNTISLTAVGAGGTWSSSNTAVGTVNTTGIVRGISDGTTTITYTVCGKFDTHVVTVNPNPTITGDSIICVDETTTLGSSHGGGSWSSVDAAVGTISLSGGVLGGLSAGTTRISYILPTGCYNSKVITVNPRPSSITGTLVICVNNTTALSSAPAGGTWSSSVPTVGTVGTSGIVTGLSAGTTTVSYVLATGCYRAVVVTVQPIPNAISGASEVCLGATTIFFSGPFGGSWSSSVPAVGTIAATTSGISAIFTSLSAGTTIVRYTFPSGCYAEKTVTVHPLPAPITGTLSICPGQTTTLNSTTAGGTWTSSNTSVALIGSATGIVTDTYPGISVITYTGPNGCYRTATLNVMPYPSVITGPLSMCLYETTTLSMLPLAIGTWSTTGPSVTMPPGFGTFYGVSVGTSVVTYTMPGGCYSTAVVTVNPLPAYPGITAPGTDTVCEGSTITMTNTTPGGTWVSMDPSIATIGSSSGIVTAVVGGPGGVVNIRYVLTSTGCFTERPIFIGAIPDIVIGDSFLCVGDIETYSVVTSVTGTWSSSNATVATVGGIGVGYTSTVSAATAGTATITFWPTRCSTPLTKVVTVNALPSAISGPLQVCAGTNAMLTSTSSGGTWSSPSPLITINALTGVYTGTGGGTAVITYMLSTGCYRTAIATLNPLPSVITGEHRICTGGTTTLNSTPSGGTWSSSDPSVGTIDVSSGVVYGVASGTSVITYTIAFGCYRTSVVTVYTTPATITGTMSVCVGLTTDLDNTVTGGTWSSGAPAVGTVDETTGVVTGISGGTATITYSTGSGYCAVTVDVTVNPTPIISGDFTICIGVANTFSAVPTGGTWISDAPLIADVGSSSGIVDGYSTGTATITYTSPAGCVSSIVVTVYTSPGAISGDLEICRLETTALSCSPSGGTWSSSATGIATVTEVGPPGSGTADLYGVAPGTATITYTLPGACISTAEVLIDSLPDISGDTLLCTADTVTLLADILGGTWSSSDPTGVYIDAVTGEMSSAWPGGTATITYIAPVTLCVRTINVTFNPTPTTITGSLSMCIGDDFVFTTSTTGGTWSSSDPTVVSVDAAGLVTAEAVGTASISYTVATGCFTTFDLTVNPLPTPIDGNHTVCVSDSTDLISLGADDGDGIWTSSTTSVATVNPITGMVTGVSPGTTIITFTLPTGCFVTWTMTVHPLPTPIFGDLSVCTDAGNMTILYDTTLGGVWSGGTPGVAVLTGTTPGEVFGGPAPGTAIFTYTLPATGCFVTAVVTVNPVPGAITGSLALCLGSGGTLACTPTGGTWVSVTPSVATVGSSSGDVFGASVGSSEITYTSPAGCYQLSTVNVFPVPGPITGIPQICIGDTTTLYCSPPGGYWLSGSPLIASIDALSGLVMAHAGGTAIITYVGDVYAECSATVVVTVGPIVGPITFSDTDTILCVGDTTTMGHPTAGGVWSGSDDAIATWTASGGTDVIITGISPGTVTISYTVTDTCGITTVTRTITVLGVPGVAPIGGSLGVCEGYTTTLIGSPPGGTWFSTDPTIASIDASGVVTGMPGMGGGSVTISYTVTNPCGSATMTANVLVNMEPYITTNFIAACQTQVPPSDGTTPVISGGDDCILVCDSTIARYYGNGVAGGAFTWVVTGGTVVADYGDSIDVLWTTVGLTGSIVLHDTFHHCIDSARACFRVIDKPTALFMSDTMFCLDANIIFTDLSTGDPSSPLISWHWDFGDGTAMSSSTPATVEHEYGTAGTYTVTLTVKNQCNCADTFKKVIHISEYTSPHIICPAVVCDSEYAFYSTPDTRCSTYVWTVIGGHFVFDTAGGMPGTSTPVTFDTTGTIMTGGEYSVTIRWDDVDSTGFGYLTLHTPGCGLCDAPTTLKVPVILQDAPIEGPDTICVGTDVAYSLPLWPATDYAWGVLENPGAVVSCREDHKVHVNFSTPGTYTIHGRYQNRIKLCGGNVYKTVTVLPPTTIDGERTICMNSVGSFSLAGTYSADWTLVDHTGSVIATSVATGPSFAHFFSSPGTFLLKTSGVFCADPVTVTVLPIPDVIDSVKGEDTVCLGRVYTYRAYDDQLGSIFKWEIVGGTVFPESGSDVVTVVWNSTGTKYLNVKKKVVAEPRCEGIGFFIPVMHEIVAPNVAGNITPCANTHENYTAGYMRGEVYDWTILPNTAGSVVSGNHAPNPRILWNNVPGATVASVIATIRKCDTIVNDTLVVTVSGSPVIDFTSVSSDTTCPNYTVSFSVTGGATSYEWDFGDGVVETEGSSHGHYFQNTTTAPIVYHVAVTPLTSPGACMLTGIATVDITVLPGPYVYLARMDTLDPCDGDPTLLKAVVSTNLPIVDYTWGGSHSSVNDTLYLVNSVPDNVQITVEASNGCIANSGVLTFHCPEDETMCHIPASAAVSCNTITLVASSAHPGSWYPYAIEHSAPATNPAVFTVTSAGVYSYRYFEDVEDGCRSNLVTATVYVVPKIGSKIKCGTGGIDTLFFYDYSDVLPSVTGYTATWYDATGLPGLTTLPGSYVLLPAGSSYVLRLRITGTSPAGPVDCFIDQHILIPDALAIDFDVDATPTCEKVPVLFPVTIISGIPATYFWDFDDGATLRLADGKREFTNPGPGSNLRDVLLTVRDVKGCIATHTETVEVFPNTLDGRLDGDTLACSSAAPVTITFVPGLGVPSIVTYEWSNGITETTGTIGVTESGAYWVTVYDAIRCQATLPVPPVHKVKIIQTPKAEIRGPRHYCHGDEINLSGYAGEPGVVEYQWYKDGIAATAFGGPAVFQSAWPTDTFTIQIVIRVYDTLTSTYCFDTSALDTVYVYPLPAPPTITGPVAIDCDLYHLRLIASSGVSGTFNWSNGTYGPVNDVLTGGPVRVWLTDLHGCKSHEDRYVPLDPNVYKPYFPNGCYEVCNRQLPLTLEGPPCVPFTEWRWLNSGGIMSSGILDTMREEDLTTNDRYAWGLNTGLCTKRIGFMDLTGVRCDACQGVNLSAVLHCDTTNPGCYEIEVGYTTTYPNMTYVLGTDIGPITPFTGTLPTAGTYLDTLTFTTMEIPLPDSITVKLVLTMIDGTKCYEEVRVELDTCWWVAERGAGSESHPHRIHATPAVTGATNTTELLAFPNPASDDIAIRYYYGNSGTGNWSLAVYDVMGRKMIQTLPESHSGSWTLNVAKWISGMYIIRMESNGVTLHTARLVITH